MKNTRRQQAIAAARRRKRITRIAVAAAAVLLVVGLVLSFALRANPDDACVYATERDTAGHTLRRAEIEIEGYGTISLLLDETTAPVTVKNFVKLAREGFYDGLTFHRIMDGYMIQGGDPEGTGFGGSPDKIFGEFAYNGYTENDIRHLRGVISMARSEAYNSASSQFFIVHEDSTGLDGQYAAFGYVTEGLRIVDEICANTKNSGGNGAVAKADQPKIVTVRIPE